MECVVLMCGRRSPLPDAQRPVVFMHGVGVGLLGYVPLIAKLDDQSQHRPVFLVEAPYVSHMFSCFAL